MSGSIHVAVLLLLAWVPLPWGSNPAWARSLFGAIVGALVLARLAMVQRGARLPELPPAARLSLRIWLAYLAWVALQWVPLPEAVVEALSPASAAAHAAARQAGGESHALSLLPGATFSQWLMSVSLFGLFWLVLVNVARHRDRQRGLLQFVLVSGLAQALYAIVMTLSGLELGFWVPKVHGIGYTTGTFVNQNHLAAYLALALSAGISLVLADLRERRWDSWRNALVAATELALSERLRVRVSLAILVIALVLTRSRMGNAAFFTALAACGMGWVLLRHRRHFVTGLALFTSLFLVDLWIVSEHYGLEKLSQRIQQTDLAQEDRASAFAEMLPLAREYWLTGSGLGTFAAAYSQARSARITSWYNHAHNDHLEFVIETGAAGYALLCALALLVLVHAAMAVRRRKDPVPAAVAFCGAMAVVCVAVQGLTDFALQIPAVAATCVALMALALSSGSADTTRPPKPGRLDS